MAYEINRGIITARQRGSRGGNNLFSPYNTPAAIPFRATVNWACDQHPIERQAKRQQCQGASSKITRVCSNKDARRGRFWTNVNRKRTILQSWGEIDILNSASRIMQCWSYYVKINSTPKKLKTQRDCSHKQLFRQYGVTTRESSDEKYPLTLI